MTLDSAVGEICRSYALATVKNQFFGDKRDYFKYSLLEHLLSGITELTQLTCAWMLTTPSANSHGNLSLVPCRGYEELATFLTEARHAGRRDVREIARYYSSRCRFNSYGDDPALPFGFERKTYFNDIPADLFQSALLFVDPDNGMEPATGAKAAHLTYEEARSLFSRLTGHSIFVVYQHLPRRRPDDYWPEVAQRLTRALGARAFYVAERNAALYLVPKPPVEAEHLHAVLSRYASLESLEGAPLPRVVGPR